MEGTGLSKEQQKLFKKLLASSRRFANIMGTLVAKYDRPFEGDKLVHIATLTYQTPDGLKVWGGSKVSQETFRNMQTSLKKETFSMQSTVPDVKSNEVDVTLVQRNDDFLKDDSFLSLPENDSNEKYMTRVDVILADDHPRLIMLDRFSGRKASKPAITLPREQSPKALCGHRCKAPWKNDDMLVQPTSPLPGPQDTSMVAASPSESLLAWRARRNHWRCSFADASFEGVESVRDLTLGDIYAEMLCSLSRCLPSQKMGLVSTNKYISKAWLPKKRRLNVALTMESSFLKINQKFQIISGGKNHLICRNHYKQNFLPSSDPDIVVKDSKPLTTSLSCSPNVSSPSALRGALHHLSLRESPSSPTEGRQAAPIPCRSQEGSQSLAAPRLCLPPALTSPKERFCPVQQAAPARDALWQERHISSSLVMPRMSQTPTNASLSYEKLYQKHSVSAPCGAGPKADVPEQKATRARKRLPFGMEQMPCKAHDAIDSMFDTYSQETTQWAQELLSLKKSGQKSKELTPGKGWGSPEASGRSNGPQVSQKAAPPRGIAEDSLGATDALLHCTASPRAIWKGDFFSPTKRRRLSSSQTWDHFSPSKMRDKA